MAIKQVDKKPNKLIIKVCGIRSASNLRQAIQAGANAIGLMQVASSPRYISVETAASLRQHITEHNNNNAKGTDSHNRVLAVMVVANLDANELQDMLGKIQPDYIQFHGKESEEFCRSFNSPYIKAIHATSAAEIRENASKYPSATYLLLDTPTKLLGGSGKVFDWNNIPLELANKLIIAGGLNPGNVASLLQLLKPAGVDVSSGVEESPGLKSQKLMSGFVESVRSAY